MAGLRQLQAEFASAVTGESEEILSRINGGGSLTPEKSLAVYSAGYVVRLTDALGETFEAVWRVLGDRLFFELAASYIRAYPSTSYNLSDYGADFPAFLHNGPVAKEFPFIKELADFEWTFKELFHQREDAPIEPAALARAGGGTSFQFAASMRLLRHERRVYPIWKLRNEKDARLPDFSGGERILLSKKGGEIYAAELSAAEHRVLTGLTAGKTVEQALEGALSDFPELGPDAVERLFSILRDSGIVRAISPCA